jgi:hypothetical protein
LVTCLTVTPLFILRVEGTLLPLPPPPLLRLPIFPKFTFCDMMVGISPMPKTGEPPRELERDSEMAASTGMLAEWWNAEATGGRGDRAAAALITLVPVKAERLIS